MANYRVTQNKDIPERMAGIRQPKLGHDHVDVQVVSTDDPAEFTK